METMKGLFQLTRPANLLIAFLSIFMGGFVTGTIQPLYKLMLACLSGMLIAGGANSINDFFDVDIDRINKPNRPLPAGRITRKQAYVFSLLLFALGTGLGAFIHFLGFIIASGSSGLLYAYSFRLKGTVVLSNLTVAFITGLAFVYGGLAVGRVGLAAVVGIFAFFYHWGREIIKDVEDVKGDGAVGIKTLPIVYGVKTALAWATGVLVFLIGLTLIPYFLYLFSIYYLIVVVVGVDFFLVFVLVSMWRNSEPEHLGRLSFLMKLDMLIGLLAVYVGS
jgi:geranylgeranylglycerol-phosphate geranylgeranyltransferase